MLFQLPRTSGGGRLTVLHEVLASPTRRAGGPSFAGLQRVGILVLAFFPILRPTRHPAV